MGKSSIWRRLFIVFVLIHVLLVHQSKGLNSEGQYLLEIKRNLVDKFHHLSNWNPNDPTPCGWNGVSCSPIDYYSYNLVVQSLNLSSMNLSGSLSPSIGGLVQLTVLDISQNGLSNNIPKEIRNCSNLEILNLNDNEFEAQIPKEIGTLSYLTTLKIYNNRFSGPFPDEIGNLSSLTQLLAYSNDINGSLPSSFCNLKSLKSFRAGQNRLTGSLPSNIGSCESLQYLGLAQNELTGSIPAEIGMLTSLRELILWDNQLTGSIPGEIVNCTNLSTLALYENKLVGSVPKELGNLINLKHLFLYRNELNGTIPREIGNLSFAEQIDFSENLLTGEIPVEFSNIKGLNLLYLFENQLTGVIPVELTSLKNLSKLDLSINNLTGRIPVGFQYLEELIMFQLFDNSLTGTIPRILGAYSLLWVVDLSNNQLTGRIPRHLCHNLNLMFLNLGTNKLTGNIPSGVTNCLPLVQLLLTGNSLTGSLPSNLCKLVNLSAIELGQNNFRGPIPAEIGNCKALQRLHLHYNYFTSELPREIGTDLRGNLPGEIGALSQLELLKLSDNDLSRIIPPELGNLIRLTELQMGGNSFSGNIPAALGSLSGLQIALNLSYNNLSGVIPQELGNLVLLEYLMLNNNHLSGEIPGSFANLPSLFGYNFSYNDLKGPIPSLPRLNNMAISSFIENRGLCGGPLGGCNPPLSSSPRVPDTKDKQIRLGKLVAIIAATIGGVSLVLIAVIIYFMRRPVRTVATLQEKPPSTQVSDIYFSPKEGFTFQDLVAATENFNESFVVGRGACGTVYKAVLPSGQAVAVKKLASQREGNNNVDNSFRAEILTLGNIRHRNIVKLYGFCYHQGSNLLLYEYMSRGSLGELLHGTSCHLDWRTRFMIALGAAQGLAYLHHDCKPRIFHRDIKSNNILLNEKFEARVGDFGLAKVMDVPQSKSMSAIAGSYGYIAPEYAYTMKVTEKCDIYSYGVVLLELLTGRTPVQPLDQGGDLVTWVRHYIRDHSLSPGMLDSRLNQLDDRTVCHMLTVMKIALICTSMSPSDRPTMREVVLMLIESNQRGSRFDISSSHDTDRIE
ncbi:hypothetical protein ES332_A08G253900v1 [Gossypium tomentosum]|uniref:non-specific serine/threonine protein kinase n=1 Tax=Gossypium tomentosum TaxID=34277 RepID=A0A5D2PM78_GOSTO|nr:hypothetical protein ES332_A08G253900v1 [Gossypium tomentosum]